MTGLAPAPLNDAATGDDALVAAVREAQADIAAGVERAGWLNDPIRYPLAAMSSLVGLFPAFLARMDSIVDSARHPLDPATLGRLEQAAATGADRRAADLARAHNLRTLLIYGGAVAAAFVLGVVLDQAVTYARAPSYQTVTLDGDAMLCRASGVVIDPNGAKYYPALALRSAPVVRR